MPTQIQHQEIPMGQALRFWLKLGMISFGGPAGQISIMHQELVTRRRWISEGRFLHALNYCMVLPGPEAQQLATYLGWLMHGNWGGIVAGALFVLPSLLVLILLSWAYVVWGELSVVAGIFNGIKPAVTAIVLHAAYRMASRTIRNAGLWAIALASFIAVFAFEVPFPAIILGAALFGFWGAKFAPTLFSQRENVAAKATEQGMVLLDDHTPLPLHARFSRRKMLCIGGMGVLLWALPMGGLWLGYGGAHALTQMSLFFTKAALLTFGGAYAVLPYVYQGAVESYGWLTPGQMMDGLALGETTPGPLIMVVAFVGFVGSYTGAVLGPESSLLAGVVAALLVTWFTFLPSFLFILMGAPFVESTRRNLQLRAPLTAITAAVVGVMVNLALFFAAHVLWPAGLGAPLAWGPALMALAAGVLLFRGWASVMQVILASGLLGALLSLSA